MRRVFEDNDYKNESGQRLVDRRLGTFYPNGDPQRPVRVNGEVAGDRLRLWINFKEPAARWDKLAGWRVDLTPRDPEWRELTGEAWNPLQKKFKARAVAAFYLELSRPHGWCREQAQGNVGVKRKTRNSGNRRWTPMNADADKVGPSSKPGFACSYVRVAWSHPPSAYIRVNLRFKPPNSD
jgi:hypothetical protein